MILITGGMGFIGLHTARSLLDLGHEVLITKYRTTRMPSFLEDSVGKGLAIATLDASDPAAVLQVLQEHDVRSIIHLAVPPRANLSAAKEFESSTRATLGVLAAAQAHGVERVTAASSLTVYWGLDPATGPFEEDRHVTMTPIHPIEADKKIDEVIQGYMTHSGELDIVRARIGIIWGPLYHTMMNAPSRLAMLALGRQERLEGQPDPLLAHPDDTLDLMYARDCGEALARLHTAPTLDHRIYNVSGGRMVRYEELIAAFNKAVPDAGLSLEIPDRPAIGHINGYCDMSRLENEIGFRPAFSLDDAVSDYVHWLRENEL